MNRVIIVGLFTFLSFLLWLYLATDHTAADNWWSVVTINEITSENEGITAIIPTYSVSLLKVFSGLVVFILFGTLLSFIVRKRKN